MSRREYSRDAEADGWAQYDREEPNGVASAPKTWLEHVRAAEAEGGVEQRRGAELARRDAEAEGWTRETARKYLATVTPTATPGFAKGYDDAVRWFAEASCGLSPSPRGPR